MKNLILVIALLVVSCSIDEPTPIRESAGVAGFNQVIVTSNNNIDFTVYSGKAFLNNGVKLYTNNKLTVILINGFYTYKINEVFYNTFDVTNGLVENLNTRTY